MSTHHAHRHARSRSIDMGILAKAHGKDPTAATPTQTNEAAAAPVPQSLSLRETPIRWTWLAKLFSRSPTHDGDGDGDGDTSEFMFPTLPPPPPRRRASTSSLTSDASDASDASASSGSTEASCSLLSLTVDAADDAPAWPAPPPLPTDWRRWDNPLLAERARPRTWAEVRPDTPDAYEQVAWHVPAEGEEEARLRARARHAAEHPPCVTRHELAEAMGGVTVVGLGGVRVVIPLTPADPAALTVHDLHLRIEACTGVPAGELQLLHAGEVVAPARTLAQLGITHGSLVVATTLSHHLPRKSKWTKVRHHAQRAAWRLHMRAPPVPPPNTLLPRAERMRMGMGVPPPPASTLALNALEHHFFPDTPLATPYNPVSHRGTLLRAFRIVNITSDDPEGDIVDDTDYDAVWNNTPDDAPELVGVHERAFRPHSFVECDEPCLITADDDAPTARLPCGHAYSCEGLFSTVRNALIHDATEVTCPALCGARWDWKMLVNMGVFAHAMERAAAERRLASNLLLSSAHHVRCSQCGTFVRKHTTEHGPVFCRVCTVRTHVFSPRRCHRRECFCPNCAHDWRDAGDACRRRKCLGEEERISVLEGSPWKFVGGIHTPAIRACPRCAVLLEHIDGCRSFVCSQCHLNFCYHCLRTECVQGTALTECFVAPVQRDLVRHTHTAL